MSICTADRRPVRAAVAATLAVVLGSLCIAGCSSKAGSTGGTAKGKSAGTVISVKLTDSGCDASALSAPAGTVSFHVTGSGSGAVSELEVQRSGRILAERENIVAGLSGDFSVSLDPGSYTLYCPGGSGPDTHTFTATAAKAAVAPTASSTPTSP